MSEKDKVKKEWVILAGFLLITALSPAVAFAEFCRADINKDGVVNGGDKILMDAEMGRDDCWTSPCLADLNSDGKIDSLDLEILKREFGKYDCFTGGEGESALEPKQEEKSVVDEEKDTQKKPLPPARFIDNGNGTVTDPKTGLMWTKDANFFDDTLLFHQALNSIDQMNSGKHSNFGYTDWRLPTLEELRSLIDYTKLVGWKHEIPKGHPFQNVDSINFNGNTVASCIQSSKYQRFVSGYCRLVGRNVRSCYGYLWPVRSVQQ